MKTEVTYISIDGRRFPTAAECQACELALTKSSSWLVEFKLGSPSLVVIDDVHRSIAEHKRLLTEYLHRLGCPRPARRMTKVVDVAEVVELFVYGNRLIRM